MERLLLKIRELEREAQVLIDQEPGSDSDPSPILQQKCKDQLQQEQRFSPRLSSARKSNAVALEDGNQTPKVS